MLLFDQDTTISLEFLPRMLEYSERLQNAPEIATVVPFIHSHGTLGVAPAHWQVQPGQTNSHHLHRHFQRAGLRSQ